MVRRKDEKTERSKKNNNNNITQWTFVTMSISTPLVYGNRITFRLISYLDNLDRIQVE